jgi:hypothetical protein
MVKKMNRLKNMIKRPKNTEISAIEDEILTLTTKRTDIDARRAAAVKVADEAREQRKIALIDSSETSIDPFNDEITRQEGVVGTCDSVVAEIDQMLDAARLRLEAARSADLRAKNAMTLEEVATTVEKHAGELEVALKPVAAILAKIRKALPENVAIYNPANRPEGRTEKDYHASSREIVSALLAEAIAHVAPYTFDEETNYNRENALFRVVVDEWEPGVRFRERRDPSSASAAARLLVGDRLRQRATAIRDGKAPAEIHGTPIYVPSVDVPQTSIDLFVVKNFSYIKDKLGRYELYAKGSTAVLDVKIATAAIEKGFALRLDSDEGRQAHDAHQEGLKTYQPWNSSLSKDECEPLGNILNFELEEGPNPLQISSERGRHTAEPSVIKPARRIPEFSWDED